MPTPPFDHKRLLAEIEDDVRRKRESGELPPHLERELDIVFARYAPVRALEGDFDQVLERAEQSTFIDVLAPLASARPGVPHVKRVVRKAIVWVIRYVAQQASGFNEAITRAVRLLGKRVDALEEATGMRSVTLFEGEVPAVALPDAEHWIPVLVGALGDVGGRVLHVECGDAALVRAMADKGIDAYGVRPTTEPPPPDLDVRTDGAVEHLGKVPEGALAGLVLSGCVDRFPKAALLRLADQAVARLAAGGVLAVVGTDPLTWERERSPVEVDLGAGRPLHAETWAHLLRERGLDVAAVHNGPRPNAAPDVAGEWAARVDALLFPPSSFAVVAVHQFLPTFSARDAVGTHARHVRTILRGMGVASDIYAEGGATASYKAYRGRPGDWLLYQLSTGCKMADWLRARPEPLLVDYHNVSPHTVFGAWEPIVGAELRRGREQLHELAPRTRHAMADSHFNEGELREAGYAETSVAPILVDLDALAVDADRAALDRLNQAKARGGADWLFVGRVAPHKCQHDVVKAFALYRRVYDPRARLHIVGGTASHAYWVALEQYIRALGLHRVAHLHGSVPDAELTAYYQAADVFVCLSMHEGFCVPLIEAMRNRLPIVAHAAAAVPETLGGAGVLLDIKDPATVAGAVHRVVSDDALRTALAEAGTARVADLSFERAQRRFAEIMASVLAGAAP